MSSSSANKPTVAFFAMTKKSLVTLQVFISRFGSAAVECVIGARDAATLDDGYEEIQSYCQQQNIPFLNRQAGVKIASQYAFAIGWRWLIHEDGFRLIVFHDSILPRYRGFAPLVNSLIQGEREIGVTALVAVKEYDRGPILAQSQISIHYPLKIAAAIEMVSQLYAQLVVDVYGQICRGESLAGVVQDESQATYSLWRDKEDYLIDWQHAAADILRLIDAVGFPYLGAATHSDNQLIRILEAEISEDKRIELRQPGKVIALDDQGLPIVVCGQGLLKITKAIAGETGESLLPLKKFRVRFR